MFEDFNPGAQRYDCIIASFVLEHMLDPLPLLSKMRLWSNRLIVVVGNANSYHRQLAVQMGLQPALETLSERDKAVGHYRVYDWTSIYAVLREAEWLPAATKGLMLKPFPNSMLKDLPMPVIEALCEYPVPTNIAANMGIVCR